MNETFISSKSAIRKGFLIVNLPLLIIIIGIPIALSYLIVGNFGDGGIIGKSIVPCIILGWLWWSYTLPKWRLWAVKNVEDIYQLFEDGISAGLMWPVGHFFQKTEINPPNQKSELRQILESRLDLTDEYDVQFINDLTK